MSENEMKLKNKIAQNVLITVIASFALIICQIINRNYIDTYLKVLLKVPSIIGDPNITASIKFTLQQFLGYIFNFIMAFIILSLCIVILKGKKALKDYYIDFVKIYKTRFFFILFLEGIGVMFILTYIVVMFPLKNAVKIDFSKLQLYIMWSKESAYENIFWLIQMFIIAFMEESVCRGVIYKGFSKLTTKLWSTVITSIVFALYHVYYFEKGIFMFRNVIVSLLLIYMLEKTKTIWWSVGIHFGLNAFLFEESSIEGRLHLTLGIIIVFSVYMILDYLIQQCYNKKELKNGMLKSELKDKEKNEEIAMEYLS